MSARTKAAKAAEAAEAAEEARADARAKLLAAVQA